MRNQSGLWETWSDLQVIVDYPKGRSASDPSMITDRLTGTIFCFSIIWIRDLEDEIIT